MTQLPVPKRFVFTSVFPDQGVMFITADIAVMEFINTLAPVSSIKADPGSDSCWIVLDARYCSTLGDATNTANWIVEQVEQEFAGTKKPAKPQGE